MKENSKTIYLTVMADFMIAKIDFNMKEFGKIIKKVDKEAFFTQMDQYMLEDFIKTKSMEQEN